jgi:NAD-reducing hydrogenase large subunit
MGRRIVIEPVTRIEGHARVTIELGEDGRVRDARVHVTELRGFERICAGRLVTEMPALTARICGICPVSHALAAAKAGDVLLGAAPPPAARLLRELLQLAQVVESHALAFHLLAAPDFVVPDGAPARSFLAMAERSPGLVRDGIDLRRFGQQVIERVAGRRVHPAFAVPGGVTHPLEGAARDAIREAIPAALAAAGRTLSWWDEAEPAHAEEAESGGTFPSLFLAMVGPGGDLAFCDGALRAVSPEGAVIADGVDPARYAEVVGEAVAPSTYVRLPYWRAAGRDDGLYRVGPLARLNVARRCGTPLADAELVRWRAAAGGHPVLSTFRAHRARLVEILHAIERIERLTDDPRLLEREVRTPPGTPRPEGVGACEAPRGTLFHHYRADGDGVVTWVNLLVASGQNAVAMNLAVRRIAERWLTGAEITPALLNRVEAGIRAFDPCLSCATHADGSRWIALRLVGPRGDVLDQVPR